MNKNASLRKLNLNRETLVPLQGSELEGVNGGTGVLCRSAVRVSQYACSEIVKSAIDLATRAFNCQGGQK